jgi:hypothetical protein
MTFGNRIFAGIATALALGFAGPVLSQTFNEAYDHVVKVQASRDSYLYVAVAGNFSAAHGCPEPWWVRSELKFDSPQTQAMMQISLSSQLSRSPVHVFTSGCTSSGHPILTQIQIQEREPPAAPITTPGGGQRGVECSSAQQCCGGTLNNRCVGQCILKTQTCN